MYRNERARVRRQRKDALSANLGRRSRTRRAGALRALPQGVPYLLVTSLLARKEK
jgi:hypothetical protein